MNADSTLWTLDGDEHAWSAWAERMTGAAPSPLADQALAEHRGRGGWALDLGCGTGRAFAALARAGYCVVGVDPIIGSLRASRDRARAETLPAGAAGGTASALPLPDASMSLVLSVGVLFHLGPAELPAALREIRRVLAPGGEAILHFLDRRDWRSKLAPETPPELLPVPAYRAIVSCFCTDAQIEAWLGEAGLRLARLDCWVKEDEPGEQINWIARCSRPGGSG